MLNNTLQKNTLENVYIQKHLTMNINRMPKLCITKKVLYLNKKSNQNNDVPQQSNIVI
jgi:hypothetical protein